MAKRVIHSKVRTIRFTQEQDRYIKAAAKNRGMTFSQYMRHLAQVASETEDTEWDILFRRLNQQKREIASINDQQRLMITVADYTLAQLLRLVADRFPDDTVAPQWRAKYNSAVKALGLMYQKNTSQLYVIGQQSGPGDDLNDDLADEEMPEM